MSLILPNAPGSPSLFEDGMFVSQIGSPIIQESRIKNQESTFKMLVPEPHQLVPIGYSVLILTLRMVMLYISPRPFLQLGLGSRLGLGDVVHNPSIIPLLEAYAS